MRPVSSQLRCVDPAPRTAPHRWGGWMAEVAQRGKADEMGGLRSPLQLLSTWVVARLLFPVNQYDRPCGRPAIWRSSSIPLGPRDLNDRYFLHRVFPGIRVVGFIYSCCPNRAHGLQDTAEPGTEQFTDRSLASLSELVCRPCAAMHNRKTRSYIAALISFTPT